MKKIYILVAFLAVLLVVAGLTNPNVDRHKDVVKHKLSAILKEEVKKQANQSKEWAKFSETLSMMVGSAIIEEVVDKGVSADNYWVLSLTRIALDKDSKIIGWGAFGNVYLSQEMDKALDMGYFKNTSFK